MSGLQKQLIESFEDQEYARAYMESHIHDKLATQIYQTRLARGLTQEHLGEASGIAQARISKIEAGDFDSLTMATLRKFANALDVTLRVELQPFSYGVHDVCHWMDKKIAVPPRMESLRELARAVTSVTQLYSPGPTIISASMTGVGSGVVVTPEIPVDVGQPEILRGHAEALGNIA